MKLELCSYSGLKIYPGHGKRMVKVDGKTLIYLNRKCERSHRMKRNPRKITWTVLYRRKHKKGIEEETKRRKTKKNTKFQRAVVGATLQDILAKRNQNPEVRKAQREQAIRAAKEKSRAARLAKKSAQTTAPSKAVPAKVQKQKAPKPVQAKAPRVGGKR